MINSRFDIRISYYLLIGTACSFLLSLFLLQLFAGLLSILWLAEKLEDKKKAFDYFTLLVVLFGLMRVVTIFLSEYPQASYQAFYKEALFYFGFFALNFYFKILDKEKFINIIYFFTAASAVVALIGVLLFNLQFVDRAQSFSSGYSTFSSYLLTGLGVAVSIPYLVQKRFSIWYWAAGMILILTGIITSLGRVNIAIAALVFTSGILLRKIKFVHIVIILSFTATYSYISFLNNQAEITQRIEQPAQLSDRDIIYNAAEGLFFEHPVFGFGPRTFHQVFPYKDLLTDKGIGSWHNDFLQIYFEGGGVGLITFLMLIIIPLVKGFRKIKMADQEEKLILIGFLTAIIALVLSSLTAGFIASPVLSVVYAFMLAGLSKIIFNNVNALSSN